MRPILLVPGILDDAHAWDAVAAALRPAGRDVVVFDPEPHPASWSPVELAAELAAFLKDVAPDGAHLVGHSRGGTAASWVAVDAPQLARTLTVVCSPPQASEAFRAHFRNILPRAKDELARSALEYLSKIPDDDFPTHALRQYRGRALVVEAGDDPLYSPTHTLFWRAFLPYADFERLESGGHEFFKREPGASWLAERIANFVAPG